jgi:peptidoglycan/LPS O-acetylase OafA/YrhL
MRSRLPALDGLRGIAAFVVLVHHVLLTDPRLAAPYLAPHPGSDPEYVRILTYTPIHLVWNGTVAVYVFFVLSGYVLALPSVHGARESWAAYYPKRLVRLYLPVMAAVLLALLWAAIVPRSGRDGASWWLNAHGRPTLEGIGQDLVLLVRPGATNSVLWSLRWEVIFSVLLPLFVLVFKRLRRLPVPALCALLAVPAVAPGSGAVHDLLTFLPMFGCGVALAWCRSPAFPAARWAWWLLLGGVVVGINASWVRYLFTDSSASIWECLRVLEVLAACALVVIVLHMQAAQRFLSRRGLLWLGSRSFSLYLVHEPIAVSIGILLGGRGPALVTLMLSIPLALLVAELFFRLIERPSLRLARAAGRPAGAERATHLPPRATAQGLVAEVSLASRSTTIAPCR